MQNSTVISSFTGNYAFLSNFYTCDIKYGNLIYKSVEHAYQASKCACYDNKIVIANAWTPGQAKKLGRQVDMIPGFDNIKIDIMRELLQIKFKNVYLAAKLYDTNNTKLIEGNTWNDKFWGCVLEHGHWIGENHLGRLLMQVRSDIRNR